MLLFPHFLDARLTRLLLHSCYGALVHCNRCCAFSIANGFSCKQQSSCFLFFILKMFFLCQPGLKMYFSHASGEKKYYSTVIYSLS